LVDQREVAFHYASIIARSPKLLSHNEIIVALATIVVFGIGAQWIGRLLGIPSLLLLLPAGLLAGDVFGLVEPEKLLGDSLFPLVTLLVALLLFQSGLQLRFADLPSEARRPVHRLITVGLAITFLGGSLASLAILNLDTGLAFLLGAIISVSGPTVVGPLLSTVRAREPTSSVLNYEGTFLDPLGPRSASSCSTSSSPATEAECIPSCRHLGDSDSASPSDSSRPYCWCS